MRHWLYHHPWSPLLLSIAMLIPSLASGDDLEAFAAGLLCQRTDCPSPVEPVPPAPLVIEGVSLPADAARQRDEEQAFLVRQGAYLTDLGAIVSLSDEPASVQLPDRGELEAYDHGPAGLLPTTGPVIITTPRPSASPQGSSRD